MHFSFTLTLVLQRVSAIRRCRDCTHVEVKNGSTVRKLPIRFHLEYESMSSNGSRARQRGAERGGECEINNPPGVYQSGLIRSVAYL